MEHDRICSGLAVFGCCKYMVTVPLAGLPAAHQDHPISHTEEIPWSSGVYVQIGIYVCGYGETHS